MARARIFKPAKTAMQSGSRARKWVLAYEPATRRQPEALMGWISAEDTSNEVQLHFETMEEAVAFATKNDLDYTTIGRTSALRSRRAMRIISATTAFATDPFLSALPERNGRNDPVAQLDRALAF